MGGIKALLSLGVGEKRCLLKSEVLPLGCGVTDSVIGWNWLPEDTGSRSTVSSSKESSSCCLYICSSSSDIGGGEDEGSGGGTAAGGDETLD